MSGAGASAGTTKTTIRIVDRAGRQVRRVVKDEQLFVEVSQPGKVDPSTPPAPIEVTFSKEGGWYSDDMTVAYGGDHRLDDTVFRSEPLSIAGGGEGGGRFDVGGFTWKTGDFNGLSTRDNHQVTVQGPDGSSTTLQVFSSQASLMHQELTDAATLQRNTGRAGAANLEQALARLAEVRTWEGVDPAKADQLEAMIRQRLAHVARLVCLAEHALAYLENDAYVLQQQNAAARYYLQGAQGQGADPGVIDHTGVERRIKQASEQVWDDVVVGAMAQLALDSYRGITNATGVAQLKTLVTGVDEMGKEVTWDKRVVAFLDLVANTAMSGAGTLKTMRDLSSRTRMGGPGRAGKLDDGSVPQRYKGDDLEQAPSGTIVDPGQLGYSPDGVAAAHQIARKHDVVIQSRPTNPLARWWKEEHGAIPKPEKFKAKTVNPIDQTIGADPTMPPGRVALFDPKPDVFTDRMRAAGVPDSKIRSTLDQLHEAGMSGGKVRPDIPPNPPGSGMSDEVWKKTVSRYSQRHGEWNGSTGRVMREMQAKGEIEIGPGGIVTVDGNFVAGDYDTWDILDRKGNPVSMEKHLEIIEELKNNAFDAQHPSHMRWDPQRSNYPEGPKYDQKFKDDRGIYEKIIDSHKDEIVDGVQKGEILLNFSPEGPPLALYSGQAPPGRWFGDLPLDYGELAPGSPWRVPTQWAWFGTGTLTEAIRMDDDAAPWSESLADFVRELEPCRHCIAAPIVAVGAGEGSSWWPKVAVGAGALLLGGLAVFGLTRGGGDEESEIVLADPVVTEPETVVTEPETVVTEPETVVTEPETVVTEAPPVVDEPADEPEIAVPAAEPEPIIIPDATSYELVYGCPSIQHFPFGLYPNSPSGILYEAIVAAIDGVYPTDALAFLDLGTDSPAMSPIGVDGIPGAVRFELPISFYALFEQSQFEVTGFGPIGGPPIAVDVGPAEGPVGGCTPLSQFDSAMAVAMLEEAGWDENGGPVGGFDPLDTGTTGEPDADPGGAGADPGGAGGSPAIVVDDEGAFPAPEDELAPVRDFLGRFDRAQQAQDVDTLFDLLDPLVIDRYGAGQCRAYLDTVVGSITEIELLDARRQPYDYPTDELTVEPFEAWNLDIEATVLGADRQQFNFNLGAGGPEGELTWFTDCGDP